MYRIPEKIDRSLGVTFRYDSAPSPRVNADPFYVEVSAQSPAIDRPLG
jgi:hypothetical protein